MSSGTILIVEDEPDVAALVALGLEAAGFDCHHVDRGDTALDTAIERRPDLVILDLLLPGVDGIEVCRRLRSDPRLISTGVIMLTVKDQAADRVAGLEAGADDYIAKPFDIDELVARVRTSLRRARQMRATSPLTGLPGNFQIGQCIDDRLQAGDEFALLHIDIDAFKAFNDHYGFLRGDQAILLTSRVIARSVEEIAAAESFVGHIGGDDFAVVCRTEHAEGIAVRIIKYFDEQAPMLYSPIAAARGYISVIDRAGREHRHPIMTVSIGIVSSRLRRFSSAAEVAAVAMEMKVFAKTTPGSAWRVDRRRS